MRSQNYKPIVQRLENRARRPNDRPGRVGRPNDSNDYQSRTPPESPVLRSQTGDPSTSSNNLSPFADVGAPRKLPKRPRTNANASGYVPLIEENSSAGNENEVIPKNLDNEFVEAIKQSNEELRTSIDDSNTELKNILSVNTLSLSLIHI